MNSKIDYAGLFSPVAVQVLCYFANDITNETEGPFRSLAEIQKATGASYMDIVAVLHLFKDYNIITFTNAGAVRFYCAKKGSMFLTNFKTLLDEFNRNIQSKQ